MPGPPLVLTPLDLQILQQIYPEGRITFTGVDPRLSVSRIARALRTSRTRVGARLKGWQVSGMLVGYDVWPNPTLLGQVAASVNLRLASPLAKRRFLDRFGLMDGALGAMEFLGSWVLVQLLAPDEAALERRLRLAAQLEGVVEAEAPLLWPRLEVDRPLSPLDLRIVAAFRARPQGSLAQVATLAGISSRTMTDRYQKLLEDRAVWFVPVYDFTRLSSPVVSLTLTLRDPADRAPVLKKLRAAIGDVLEFDRESVVPDGRERMLGVTVLAPSAAAVEDIEAVAASLEGVTATESSVLVRTRPFRETMDALLREALDPRRRAAPRYPRGRR